MEFEDPLETVNQYNAEVFHKWRGRDVSALHHKSTDHGNEASLIYRLQNLQKIRKFGKSRLKLFFTNIYLEESTQKTVLQLGLKISK